MTNFRFADGVEFLGSDRLLVTMPTDEEGFFGRECPSCDQHFRVAAEDYSQLPDDQVLWCVYCGYQDDVSEFVTMQQLERVKSAASDYATQRVGEALDQSFGRAFGRSRRSRDSFLQVSFRYRSEPFYPSPLPGIDEERLIRERACESCGLRYAVFGEHRFCPVCGQLPALVVALDGLSAELVRLDALSDIPPDTHAQLRESGGLNRTYLDTIENAVGIVEAMAKRVFLDYVADAEQILRDRGQVFQRLNDLADLFSHHVGVDVRGSLGSAWTELQEAWAARHVFTHGDGIVDSRYLAAVPRSPLQGGQRLTVSDQMARTAVRDAEHLCRALNPNHR